MNSALHKARNAALRFVGLTLLAWFAALCADAVFISARAGEATNEPGGRYLFIVDTSSAMERRAENTRKLVGHLLGSGLNGQLRPGDTIGVWTFNEKLNAGKFPLQVWTPQARQSIAQSTFEFLKLQRHEKPTQIDKALAPMMRVIKNSHKITVLLISEGDDKIQGTPFDNEINEAFKLNYAEQRKAQMPFVTVLRAKKGEFIGSKVSMPPWPVEFPEFPAEPQIAAPALPEKPKPEASKIQRPPPTVPSLIVIGKKPEPPSSAPTNATPTVAAKPETTPTPAPPLPTANPQAEPTPVATTAAEANSIVKNPQPPQAAIHATPQQATVVPSKPAKSEIAPPPKTEPTSVAVTVPDAARDPSPKPESIAATNVAAVVPPVAPAPGESEQETTLAPTQTVVQIAVAAPSETVFNRTQILMAGMVLLLVALGLVYALMRRSRTTARESLITRSMDRNDK